MLPRNLRTLVLKAAASLLAPAFDFVCLLGIRRAEQSNKVLLVRLDAIGDFVLWLNSASQLVAHYRRQGKYVVLLGNKTWAAWASDLHIADEVWAIEPARVMKSPAYRAPWVRRIRRAGFDVAVNTTFSRELLTGDSFIRATAAPQRIGSVGDCSNTKPFFKRLSDRWYTKLIAAARAPRMELQRHAEFVQGLTGVRTLAQVPALPASAAPDPAWLPPSPYAVIFPSASWSGRLWPTPRFVAIAERLMAQGLRVVLAGGPADQVHAAPIAEALQGRALNLVGQTSLAQLAELFRHSRLVLTNETSAVHIGAAVRARVLCIIGGGHYGRFAPYIVDAATPSQHLPTVVSHAMPCFGCNWSCIYERTENEPVKCIDNIGVDQVWDCAVKMLNESQAAY